MRAVEAITQPLQNRATDVSDGLEAARSWQAQLGLDFRGGARLHPGMPQATTQEGAWADTRRRPTSTSQPMPYDGVLRFAKQSLVGG
jgi:hypothetical protein